MTILRFLDQCNAIVVFMLHLLIADSGLKLESSQIASSDIRLSLIFYTKGRWGDTCTGPCLSFLSNSDDESEES